MRRQPSASVYSSFGEQWDPFMLSSILANQGPTSVNHHLFHHELYIYVHLISAFIQTKPRQHIRCSILASKRSERVSALASYLHLWLHTHFLAENTEDFGHGRGVQSASRSSVPAST